MRILVACEESQAVTIELRKLGHEAYSCDIELCSGGHPEWHILGDVLNVIYSKGKRLSLESGGCLFYDVIDWDMMIAHPPCTRLTNSGVRWLKEPPKDKTLVEMWSDLFSGAEFYKNIRDCEIPKKCIENPVMHKHARELIKPGYKQTVQPWYFGDKTFKATGYELIGLPDLVDTNRLTPPEKGTEEHKKWSWIHRLSPGPERGKLRSKTPLGIAKAMAEQWAGQAS